jgi:hypothetical protein
MSNTVNSPVAELGEAIDSLIKRRLLDIHTSMPGIVQSYDVATQTAEVTIAMNRTKLDGETVDAIKLPNVRVMFPASSRFQNRFPLVAGDTVLLVFHERDCDSWRGTGNIGTPQTNRKFSLADVVAIPGYFDDKNVPEIDASDDDAHVIYFDDVKVVLTSDGKILLGKIGSAAIQEPLVLGTELKTYLTAIHDKLDALMGIINAGDFLLVTSPGNPTGPNPAKITTLVQLKADLLALKSSPVVDGKLLSNVSFTEKGA